MVIMLQYFALLVETSNKRNKNLCIHIHVNYTILLFSYQIDCLKNAYKYINNLQLSTLRIKNLHEPIAGK